MEKAEQGDWSKSGFIKKVTFEQILEERERVNDKGRARQRPYVLTESFWLLLRMDCRK